MLEAATVAADQKCGKLGLTADAPYKTCADAKKTGDFFVMVDGSKNNVAMTRCWSDQNGVWTLVGRANGSGREFNPKSDLWDNDKLLNEKSKIGDKTSMKNAFWTGTKAREAPPSDGIARVLTPHPPPEDQCCCCAIRMLTCAQQ